MFRCYFLLTFSIARYKAGVHQNVVAHEILLPLRANQQQRRCWIITITRRSTRSIHIGVKRRLLESSANLCLQQKAALLANVGNQPKTRAKKSFEVSRVMKVNARVSQGLERRFPAAKVAQEHTDTPIGLLPEREQVW